MAKIHDVAKKYGFKLEQQPKAASRSAWAHLTEADRPAAREVVSLLDLIDRLDAARGDGRVENGRGQARASIDIRLRASGKLQGWLAQLGLTSARARGAGLAARRYVGSRRRHRTASCRASRGFRENTRSDYRRDLEQFALAGCPALRSSFGS